MAETPKAENETGTTVTGAAGADTLTDAAGTTAQDRTSGRGDDTVSAGSDSVSGAAAFSATEGGEGQDSVSGVTASDTVGSVSGPWASPGSSGSDDSTAAQETRETSEPPAARRSTGGGGATRLIVFLILLVLIGGVGYATYPEWRDEAVPYAAMIGVTLPAAPTEVDPDATAPQIPSSETASRETASGDTASQSADSTTPVSAPASGPSTDSTPGAVAAVSEDEFRTLAERVTALEGEIQRLTEAPESPAPAAVPAGDTPELTDRIGSLESRLTALSDEMAIVRQGLGSVEDTDGVSAVASDLSDRLSQLDSRLSALETQPSGPPPVSSEDLASLRDRIEGLQKSSEGGDADLIARLESLVASQKALAHKVAQGRDRQEQAGAFLLATNLLAAASNESGAYAAELDAVETAALDQPEIGDALGVLRTHAEGVASEADLRARFPAVAASVIDASLVGAGDDVVGTALTRIASLVTLRRTETADGDDIDAIVNRAEAAANAGDLPAAVSALEALDGDPAKVAQPWIAEAEARIAVDRAVRTLQSRALATLSGG